MIESPSKYGFKKLYIECDCADPSHLMRIVIDEDALHGCLESNYESETGIYFETQCLNGRVDRFYKKLYLAFCYLFNVRCNNYWNCTLISYNDLKEMYDMFGKVIELKEPKNENKEK